MSVDLESRVRDQFAEHARLVEASRELAAPIARAVAVIADALRAGGKVLACGNGGSAADAQHFAAELVNRFLIDREPLAALALTGDTALLTAVGNDVGYDQVFDKQVRALGRRGDVLLAISTSGHSVSVLNAVRCAAALGLRIVALTGNAGGQLAGLLADTDVHITVPHMSTPRIQELHILTLHCLCDGIDTALFGGADTR
jgi:D-sedoheptulose 7-phosphate isomerase